MTAKLSDASVFDLQGRPVPLTQLWADGPAVLVFLRHYG